MDEYIQILDRLFTPQQQTALAIITIGVMSLTQAFKNIYFGFFPTQSKPKRKAILWLAALIFGMLGGYTGYLSVVPVQPLWFWIFCGVSAVGLAIGIFHLITNVILPRLQKK
jgi:hypothetical protein